MAVYQLKRLFCCLFLVALAVWAFSQEQPEEDNNDESVAVSVRLTVEPLYLFNRTAKAALETKKPGSRLAHIVSPELYFGTVYDKSLMEFKKRSADKLFGFGIGLQQKLYGKDKQHGPYFAWDAAYRHLIINYSTEGFIPYEKDGLQYYDYGPYSKDLKIHSFMGSLLGGIQLHSESDMLFDFFLGFGYKASTKKGNEHPREYNQEFSSYAYNGFLYRMGFRIGYQIQ